LLYKLTNLTVQRLTSLTDITRRIELQVEDFPEDNNKHTSVTTSKSIEVLAAKDICVSVSDALTQYFKVFVAIFD
jgi:hypothetical protein